MSNWKTYLQQAVDAQASDIFPVAGGPVCLKIDGNLRRLNEIRLSPEDTRHLLTEIYASDQRSMNTFLNRGDDDFSFSVPSLARFRVNTYRQRGSMAAVIRIQLASVLRTVVSPHLLPDIHEELIPIHEILRINSAVKSMIRDCKNHQMENIIASGARNGMITVDKAILSRYKTGSISRQTALEYADHPDQLERLLTPQWLLLLFTDSW